MPYLAWTDGTTLQRLRLGGECILGSDPLEATLCPPEPGGIARKQAALRWQEGRWWLKRLAEGHLHHNGRPVNHEAVGLQDGDSIALGNWELRFSLRFPGLDALDFIEGAAELPRLDTPGSTARLGQAVLQMRRATAALLSEGDPGAAARGLLEEAMGLLSATAGAIIQQHPDGTMKVTRQVGDLEAAMGLPRIVVDYVVAERVPLLSRNPMADPRFEASSLPEGAPVSLMAAPLVYGGKARGVLYLQRSEGIPFEADDLAIFTLLADHAALALRHGALDSQALSHAELEGELMRLRTLEEQLRQHHGRLLAAMVSPLCWLRAWAKRLSGPAAESARAQLNQLAFLIDQSQQQGPEEPGHSVASPLRQLLAPMSERWRALAEAAGSTLELPESPEATVWIGAGPALEALSALVEPSLMELPQGSAVPGQWSEEPGAWCLQLTFPPAHHGSRPDTWSQETLRSLGIRWRWADQVLHLSFPVGPEAAAEESPRPLLGLVTEELALLGLFQSAADAGSLNLFPLEEEPPLPPLPGFEVLVVDVRGVMDAPGCIQAYRRHPSFSTTPILAVRAKESETSALLAAGATDWLSDHLHWEALHHRLQVLRSHQELQRKARSAERLSTFRQMAGALKHEINNPLAVISLQVELLQRKFTDEPKLEKIAEQVERIQALLQVLQKMREADTEAYPGGGSIMKF
ncbi:MAG TPA: GAF domain-containing protein [Holophagaceae bacterium]|nr:GAF domain-containing protein [Holophagaceae bacterium]